MSEGDAERHTIPTSDQSGALPTAPAPRHRADMPSAIARVTDEALKAPVPDKIRPVSKRLRHALDLLQRGECRDIKAAAERVGMARESLSRSLRLPHVQVFIARKSRETIAFGQLRASARLIELIDAGSEHVSADVSKHTLAIAGIKPTADAQVSVNIDIKAGYVIDLTDEPKRVSDAQLAHGAPCGPVVDHE